jgi:protein tyrosine/serine phosphatase
VTSRWIDLDGAANVRDLGGLPAGERTVRRDRLIRSDNLQGLTPDDVHRLVDEHHVRAVADLRTQTEVDLEGPGPLTAEPEVTIEHLSLFAEAGEHTDVEAAEDSEDDGADGPVLMPWQKREAAERERPSIVEIYLRYLDERPDSVLAALRLIAYTDGATVVHCAAGKDRTGVVVAMALDEVGVDRAAIVDDYVATGERLYPLLARLKASSTYSQDVQRMPDEQHLPRRESMAGFLAALDEVHGGTANWLRKHGWTDADDSALRTALLG